MTPTTTANNAPRATEAGVHGLAIGALTARGERGQDRRGVRLRAAIRGFWAEEVVAVAAVEVVRAALPTEVAGAGVQEAADGRVRIRAL